MLINTPELTVELIEPRTILFLHGRNSRIEVDLTPLKVLYSSLKEGNDPVRILVFTDGGAPSPAQRAMGTDLMGGKASLVRNAVVTDLASARFVVSSMALFVENVASFSSDQTDQALSFLQFPSITLPLLRTKLVNLQKSLNGHYQAFDRGITQLQRA